MKLLRALLPLGLVLLPLLVRAAEPFEGTMTLSLKDSGNKKAPQSMTYSMKNGNLRVDMQTERGTMAMIMDIKDRTMIMLMPQQRMYMQNTIPAPDPAKAKAAAEKLSIKDTGVRETILGYKCEKYEMTNERGTTDLWLAPDLQGFSSLYTGRQMGNAQIPDGLQDLIKNGGGFPLKMVSNRGNGSTFSMEVTAVNPQKLSDDLFVPPSDYRKFDMAGMINAARGGSGN